MLKYKLLDSSIDFAPQPKICLILILNIYETVKAMTNLFLFWQKRFILKSNWNGNSFIAKKWVYMYILWICFEVLEQNNI